MDRTRDLKGKAVDRINAGLTGEWQDTSEGAVRVRIREIDFCNGASEPNQRIMR